MKRRTSVALGAALMVVLAACGSNASTTSGTANPPPTIATFAPTYVPPTPEPHEPSAEPTVQEPASTPSCASLEKCYGPNQMMPFYNAIIGLVEDFVKANYSAMPRPDGYVLVLRGTTASSGCGVLKETVYAYCPADRKIYLGESTLWRLYSQLGDAAAALGFAHEWGHHIQNVAGVPRNAKDKASEIRHENQADCVGGAVQRHFIKEGVFEQDDTDDVADLIRAIAESEGDPNRDHGTLEERTESWILGLRNGLPACNAFYPATPLVSS